MTEGKKPPQGEGRLRYAKTLLFDAADQVLSPVGVSRPYPWSFMQWRFM